MVPSRAWAPGGEEEDFVTSDFLFFIPNHVRQEVDAVRPEVSERVRYRRIFIKTY
jgi:hypothetical protein